MDYGVEVIKPILALETSQELCGASIYLEQNIFFEEIANAKNIHSEKIFQVIDDCLILSGVNFNEIKAIAVSSGPGSFTGLRIGMSAAKGIATGGNIPIIPVPTLEALALQICSYLPNQSEFFIANKVNVDEIYFAGFINTKGTYKISEELKIISRDDLVKKNITEDLIYGNAIINKRISAPNPYWIGKWAYLFGKDLLTYDYDFMEPSYHKNFIVR